MPIKIGINGFGRIGRNFYRAIAKQSAEMEIVAVNDLGDTETMAHLLKYDSVHGNLENEINAADNGIMIDGELLQVLSERNPQDLPWGDLGVDVVIESTGIFTDREKAAMHLEAGAPLVIVSAPANGADATFVVGVNDSDFDKATHTVISNASCTTNCFVPMVQVLDDAFGVEKGLMTTVHAYTGDQSLVDGPHSDLRRARASAVNIIPTSTGAARATGLVLQAMNGKLDGISLRVPIPDGSITDFTALLNASPSVEEINSAFKDAASSGPLANVLDYSDRPLVSSDIVGNPASCVFDSGLTMTMDNLVKISGWYDNEWGYSNRLVDLVAITAS
ncbi:MAG: type I glyceraldehyde-3-phosphate dehydrogenase [Acidimicrobiales bacterium]|jgi:glyceraldehyde 3-phosphate dehydrogenase|nr:type I glyceraldehyde-3-phosphate dehydrogenase [Acidimicrobiales bacterium]|tara:strand:- start:476 stop:1477 length:1002 start_codon:yes stop_codon:yes gene_type:complete